MRATVWWVGSAVLIGVGWWVANTVELRLVNGGSWGCIRSVGEHLVLGEIEIFRSTDAWRDVVGASSKVPASGSATVSGGVSVQCGAAAFAVASCGGWCRCSGRALSCNLLGTNGDILERLAADIWIISDVSREAHLDVVDWMDCSIVDIDCGAASFESRISGGGVLSHVGCTLGILGARRAGEVLHHINGARWTCLNDNGSE